MKTIERDNVLLNYNVSGEGDTTLLFVHGSYIDQQYWSAQVSHFSSKYTVVTIDLAAHGLSGRNRQHWSIKGMAEDVIEMVQKLALKKVIFIGHSLGAAIGLIALTMHPELFIGFISVDFFKNAGTPLSVEHQGQVVQILAQLKTNFADTNEQYARMVLLSPQTPRDITDRVVNDYRQPYEPMGQATTPEIFEFYKVEQQLLPLLQHKLYLINVDYIPTNEEPLKQYPGAGYRLLQMHGTCHYPMLEHPEELNRLIGESIDDILDTKAGS